MAGLKTPSKYENLLQAMKSVPLNAFVYFESFVTSLIIRV